MIHTSPIPFFTAKELACPCCDVIQLDINFAAHLGYLRAKWGKPLTANSVCRCPTHNAKVGGHQNSLHLTKNPKWKTAGTMAADIAWRGWSTEEKIKFARLAHEMGLRIGLHDGFCHVDLGRTIDGISARPFQYGTWSGEFTPDEII